MPNNTPDLDELNKAGISKWLIEALKAYDGTMSTNPDKEHKWRAKRKLQEAITDWHKQETLKLIPEKMLIPPADCEGKDYALGIMAGHNQVINELRSKINQEGGSDE